MKRCLLEHPHLATNYTTGAPTQLQLPVSTWGKLQKPLWPTLVGQSWDAQSSRWPGWRLWVCCDRGKGHVGGETKQQHSLTNNSSQPAAMDKRTAAKLPIYSSLRGNFCYNHHHPSLALLPPRNSQRFLQCSYFRPTGSSQPGGQAHGGASLEKPNMHYHPHPLVGHSHKHGGMSTHTHLLQWSIPLPCSHVSLTAMHTHTQQDLQAHTSGSHAAMQHTPSLPCICAHTLLSTCRNTPPGPACTCPACSTQLPSRSMYTLPLAPSTYPSQGWGGAAEGYCPPTGSASSCLAQDTQGLKTLLESNGQKSGHTSHLTKQNSQLSSHPHTMPGDGGTKEIWRRFWKRLPLPNQNQPMLCHSAFA